MANLKILLVEDDMLSREMIRLFLERRGCEIDLAEDARQAIRLFSQNCYDLVFLDIVLPDFNGYYVANAMRRMENNNFPDRPKVPICALTTLSREEVGALAKASGMDMFIHKPYSAEGIVEAISLVSKGVQQSESQLLFAA